MTYQTITTFEKSGVYLEAELWTTPGWRELSQCFLYENNPYVSRLEVFEGLDGSYLEYHLDFHNEDAYKAWHEEWYHVHDTVRFELFKDLRKNGVTIQLYWPGEELGGNEDVLPLESFVSKISS